MYSLYQQVNIAQVTRGGNELLLHFFNIIDFNIFGWFGRRGKQQAFRSALVIALKPGLENG
jgi:hypothetical protein